MIKDGIYTARVVPETMTVSENQRTGVAGLRCSVDIGADEAATLYLDMSPEKEELTLRTLRSFGWDEVSDVTQCDLTGSVQVSVKSKVGNNGKVYVNAYPVDKAQVSPTKVSAMMARLRTLAKKDQVPF
jgi:hypothetical protein